MSFCEELKSIGAEFENICSKQKESYFHLGTYRKDVDPYNLLKILYDQDKVIRLKDSYNVEHIEECLKELRTSAESFLVEPTYQIFLDRFIVHINYNMELIQLMKNIEKLAKDGRTIEDRILYLLNYCIITERTSYFQGLFISKLNDLNTEILGINNADYNLFYRVGVLNFKRHLYSEAILNLARAIAIMEDMAAAFYESATNQSQADFRKTLFKIKMLYAVSHEFQGDFKKAIQLLIGNKHIPLLKEIKVGDYLYRLGGDSQQGKDDSLDVVISSEQENVIDKVQIDIVDVLCLSPEKDSCFAFALEADKWFFGLSIEEKKKMRFLDNEKNHEYFLNEQYGYDQKILYFENENAHEVLHILAHTINEYGVAERSQALLNGEKNQEAGQLLVAARALMLFVAKNQRFMLDCQKCLTCLATIFAEVGDFESAKAQLIENANSNYYKNKDLLVQAEIEFFYYIVSLMDNPNSEDRRRDEFYSKYSRCCYNQFDYDALTQIEMYRFKYSVATAILYGSNDEDIVKKELHNRQIEFGGFIASLQSVFVSGWTKNEHDKINIMFQFLVRYYHLNDHENTLNIVDLAKKYLYLYAKSIKFRDTISSSILSREGVPAMIEFLDNVFHQPVLKLYESKQPIQIGNCIYHNIATMSKQEADNYIGGIENDADNTYFITTSDTGDRLDSIQRHILMSSSEEEALQYFLIHCAFDSILYDFINPQNIFILVPFVGAEPLKYQFNSFDDLLLEICQEGARELVITTKTAQRDRITSKFLVNYNFDSINNWVDRILSDFPLVEMVLWNDEDIDTVHSKERYYMRSRGYPNTRRYPLINYPDFISTLGNIISVAKKHHPSHCTKGECCQWFLERQEKSTIKLNTFFLLRSFCVDRLSKRKILVKYKSRRKQWGILVVKMPVPPDDIKLLQAYMCENNTYINATKLSENANKPNAIICSDEKKLELLREEFTIRCDKLNSDADEYFTSNINALTSVTSEVDTNRKNCYEKGSEELIRLFVSNKQRIQNTKLEKELKDIISEFSNAIDAIKASIALEIKQINSKE